jgi:GT2 family glycosyltransferase
MRWFSRQPEPPPAFTIIVCSHRPERAQAIRAHYAALFRHHRHEFIGIPDAKSLCEGYARGLRESTGRLVIFSHDDVEFVTPDVAERLERHLATYDVVGIAGTTKLINAVWTSAGDPHSFAFVIYPEPEDGMFSVRYAGRGPLCVDGIQALDGCFFACRREVAEAVGFDERTFNGFHFYDIDFTYNAYLQGHRLAVCRDLALIHRSKGNQDSSWLIYRDRFLDKYRGQFADGVAANTLTINARVPRSALAQLCAPEQLIKAIRWH